MNTMNSGFSATEAHLRYLDADFVILKPGTFVRCAISGDPIQIDDLKYWNVDAQEAYKSSDEAFQAHMRDQKS